ncbi:MAG: hypothetical protein ACYC35_16580 [Pirellulales bacterium]
MCRRVAVIALGLTFLVLLSATPATATDNVLKLVPDSALGFVVVNCPSDADAKLQELGRQMQLPIPSLLARLKQKGGIRDGLDEQGTAALVVLPPAGGAPWPTPILLVPVTDYGKFLAQFKPDDTAAGVTKIEVGGVPMWVRDIGGYAALTDMAHKEALAENLKLSREIPEALAPWSATLAENDVAGVILPPGIKLMSGQVQMGIQTMKLAMAQAGEQAKQAAAVFDLYEKMFQAAEKEMSAVGFGVRLDKQGVLHATERARFVPGGSWARLAAQVQPAKESLLAGLPTGPFVVAGGGTISESIWDPMMAFSMDMMKSMHDFYGLSEEQIEQMPKISLAAMKRVRSISMVLGVGPSGVSPYSKLVVVMRVDNTDAFMADYEKSIKEYGKFARNAHSTILQPIEVEKGEIDGTAALQFTTKAPQMPTAQQTPQYSKMMEVFFGPGGRLTAWVVPVDEHTVVAGYVSKDLIRSTLQAIKQGSPGLGGDADVSRTAALLPAGAPSVAFWSPQGTVDFIIRMIPAFAPGDGKTEFKIPEFDKTPPIGFAVTSAPNELQGHMVVPAEVLKAIGQYVGKVKPKGAARELRESAKDIQSGVK